MLFATALLLAGATPLVACNSLTGIDDLIVGNSSGTGGATGAGGAGCQDKGSDEHNDGQSFDKHIKPLGVLGLGGGYLWRAQTQPVVPDKITQIAAWQKRECASHNAGADVKPLHGHAVARDVSMCQMLKSTK